jgi:hypothetical protein
MEGERGDPKKFSRDPFPVFLKQLHLGLNISFYRIIFFYTVPQAYIQFVFQILIQKFGSKLSTDTMLHGIFHFPSQHNIAHVTHTQADNTFGIDISLIQDCFSFVDYLTMPSQGL